MRGGLYIEMRQVLVSWSSKKTSRTRRWRLGRGRIQAQASHPCAPPLRSTSPCSRFIPHQPTETVFPRRQSKKDIFHSSLILRGSLAKRGILKCREGSLETPSLTMGEKSKVYPGVSIYFWGFGVRLLVSFELITFSDWIKVEVVSFTGTCWYCSEQHPQPAQPSPQVKIAKSPVFLNSQKIRFCQRRKSLQASMAWLVRNKTCQIK